MLNISSLPIKAVSIVILGVSVMAGCGGSDSKPEQASSYTSCVDLLSYPDFGGEGMPMGGLETSGSSQCVIAFPGQSAALAFLGISTSCPKDGAVFVTFDLQEDGATWFLNREASATGNQDSCGFSQEQTPIVITDR